MTAAQAKPKVRVVLFTGGRGSSVLSRELIKSDQIALTLAINGYDDGLSTGEVRRFLGDCLGPSDFRKNASRLAGELRTCPESLVALLDLRLPDGSTGESAAAAFALIADPVRPAEDEFQRRLRSLAGGLDETARRAVAERLSRFQAELALPERCFNFADCSVGNLVFAGCFLLVGRNFNLAVEDYNGILRLPPGLIENVTDGRNAYLVAYDREQRILPTEAAIVSSATPHQIQEIFLLDQPLTGADVSGCAGLSADEIRRRLLQRSIEPVANPRLLERLAEADLIVYAPGTQHSSLFPSYLTPGVGAAIARNLRALKLLVTNLHEDAEIAGNSAVDLINRALYYLKGKGRLGVPSPSLITHYFINDPARPVPEHAYVPLGRLESLEDPRLVRIGDYEEGITGRHDASKIVTPFIEALLRRGDPLHLAVVLLDSDSLDKIGQTIAEMVRASVEALPMHVTVFYSSTRSFEGTFTESLPFPVTNMTRLGDAPEDALASVFNDARFEYIVLFESSGMYQGEDIVSLASQLGSRRLDAVWGSRRLSVKDIQESYKLRYREHVVRGAISYLGSHLLSLAYLMLYGRYISDTLSGVRAIRAAFMRPHAASYQRKDFNQIVLSDLLRRRAEIFETPVHYFPISPEKVRRTTFWDGLQSLGTIVLRRLRAPAPLQPAAPSRPEPARAGPRVQAGVTPTAG